MMSVAWGDMTRGMDEHKLSREEITLRSFGRSQASRKKKYAEKPWTYDQVVAYLRILRGDLR